MQEKGQERVFHQVTDRLQNDAKDAPDGLGE